MDPITLGIGAVGLGLKLFGSLSASSDANKISQVEQQKFGVEQQVNDQRQQAMNLSARRQQLEIFRNTQRARAQGLNAAVQQGAQFGSGFAGGQASTQSQGLFNSLGVSQNQQIGNNIFGLDSRISGLNSQEAGLKGQMATDQGWSSLGGSILSSAGTLGGIAKSAGGAFGNIGGAFMGGGSPSGY